MEAYITSYYASVIIQIFSLFVQYFAYMIPVKSELYALKYALNFEFFVSCIEIVIYLWIGTNLYNLSSMMKKRYIDWFITTNSLIFSFVFLFIFLYEQEEEVQRAAPHTMNTLVLQNITKIAPIVLFNTLMLWVGYCGEINMVSKMISFSVGFFFFFLSFYYQYVYFASKSQIGKKILYGLACIWSLYGIAHLFSPKWKHTCYNILDLISKNAFGIILSTMVLYYSKYVYLN